MMLLSTCLAFAPAASASNEKFYPTHQSTTEVAVADFDGDNQPDIVGNSEQGNKISIFWGDSLVEDFPVRTDVWVSNNDSHHGGFDSRAAMTQIAVGDVTGDGNPDIVLWMAMYDNFTVLEYDGGTSRTFTRTPGNDIPFNGFVDEIHIADVDGQIGDEIVVLTTSASGVGQNVTVYYGGSSSGSQSTPLDGTKYYYQMEVGNWGEAEGTCDPDLDVWLVSGNAAGLGTWDNLTVLEYARTPVSCSGIGFTSDVATPADHKWIAGYRMTWMDIFDEDGDGVIDVWAGTNGDEQNLSVVKRSSTGNPFSMSNAQIVECGYYFTIELELGEFNGDSEVDVVLAPKHPTYPVVDANGNQMGVTFYTDDLYVDMPILVILSDGQGNFLTPLEFTTPSTRPSGVVIADVFGSTTPEIVAAHSDMQQFLGQPGGIIYDYEDSWTQVGQRDGISVITLDVNDIGVTGIGVSPAGYGQIGAGARNVTVTLKNQGTTTQTGTAPLTVSMKEITGVSNTTLYSNGFDSGSLNSPTVNSIGANLQTVDILTTSETWDATATAEAGSQWHVETRHPAAADMEVNDTSANLTNPTDFLWAGSNAENVSDNVVHSGYFGNRDDMIVLSDVDLTSADGARMDLDYYFHGAFNSLVGSTYQYQNGQTAFREETLLEDLGSIEVRPEGGGWNTLFDRGGFDTNRMLYGSVGLDEGQNSGPVAQNQYHATYQTQVVWSDLSLSLDNYVGQIVDIRFRFQSAFLGSINPAVDRFIGYDGFAVDNITIIQETYTFGSSQGGTQQLVNLNSLGVGEEIEHNVSFNFQADNSLPEPYRYLITAELATNSDEDDGNNDINFDITTMNLFDPAVVEFTTFGQDEFASNSEYPEEARTIGVTVQHLGSTALDFEVELNISKGTASPPVLSETFTPGATKNYALSKPPGTQGDVTTNTVMGDNVFWFGDPNSGGYGDDWDNNLTFSSIDLQSMRNAELVNLEFDYFADLHYLIDSDGSRRAGDLMEIYITWDNGTGQKNGLIRGTWDQYDDVFEAGEPCGMNFYGDHWVGSITDFGNNYRGDEFFQTDGEVAAASIDLTRLWVLNQTGQFWSNECIDLRGSMINELTFRFRSGGTYNGDAGYSGVGLDNITVLEYQYQNVRSTTQSVTGLDAQEETSVTFPSYDFKAAAYRFTARTIFDNSTMGTAWFDDEQMNPFNDEIVGDLQIVSTRLTISADSPMMGTYPIDDVKKHRFGAWVTPGILGGSYTISLEVEEEDGSTVSYGAPNNPYTFERGDPNEYVEIEIDHPWQDGEAHIIRWIAAYASDGTEAASPVEHTISFAQHIDIALLASVNDGTAQQLTDALALAGLTDTTTYTVFEGSADNPSGDDWGTYLSTDWLSAYDRIIIPAYDEADTYERLSLLDKEGTAVVQTVLETLVKDSSIDLQIHLAPTRQYTSTAGNVVWWYSEQASGLDLGRSDAGWLPYGVRPAPGGSGSSSAQSVAFNKFDLLDPYHPLLDGLVKTSTDGYNIQQYMPDGAQVVDTTSTRTAMPNACKNSAKDLGSGWRSVIGEEAVGKDATSSVASVLAVCTVENRGSLIVTTLPDFPGSNLQLYANMLTFDPEPFSETFEDTSDFDIMLNGDLALMTNSEDHAVHWMKNDAQVSLAYDTTATDLTAYWVLTGPTDWDGETSENADFSSSPTYWGKARDVEVAASVSTTFCLKKSGTGPTDSNRCQVPDSGAYQTSMSDDDLYEVRDDYYLNNGQVVGWWNRAWTADLYLYDAAGHSLHKSIDFGTNPSLADEFDPVADYWVDNFTNSAETDITKSADVYDLGTWDDSSVPYLVVRLDDDGEKKITFDAKASYDPDASDDSSSTGIEKYHWKVRNDADCDESSTPDEIIESKETPTWDYTFENIVVGKRDLDRSLSDDYCGIPLNGFLDIRPIFIELRVEDKAGRWSNASSPVKVIKVVTVPHYYDLNTGGTGLANVSFDDMVAAPTERFDGIVEFGVLEYGGDDLVKGEDGTFILKGSLLSGPSDGVEIKALVWTELESRSGTQITDDDVMATFGAGFTRMVDDGHAAKVDVNGGSAPVEFTMTFDLSEIYLENAKRDIRIYFQIKENSLKMEDSQAFDPIYLGVDLTLSASRVYLATDVVIRGTALQPGGDCSDGGFTLEAGLDDDADGELDDDEVILTRTDCNQGADLVVTNFDSVEELADDNVNCAEWGLGGLKFVLALDKDQDSYLSDTDQKIATLYLCNGDEDLDRWKDVGQSSLASTQAAAGVAGGSSVVMIAGIVGAVVLVGLVLMFVMGRSGGSDDAVDFQSVATGGAASPAVAAMDPAEAYVQQLIAQGYPEETARAYAAHYFSQQQ